MAEQKDILRVYQDDSGYFVELHRDEAVAKFRLLGEMQFDMTREFATSLRPDWTLQEIGLAPTWRVSFDMAEYIPPSPKPTPKKRSWARDMGLRKPR